MFLQVVFIKCEQLTDRSSRLEVFCKKGVLRNFTKFTGKHRLSPAALLKKRLWHRCFPVNFVKFLRTPFFIEHLWGWLLLPFSQLGKFYFRFYPVSVTLKLQFFFNMILLNRKHTKSINQEPMSKPLPKQLVNVIIICNKSNTFQKLYGAFWFSKTPALEFFKRI